MLQAPPLRDYITGFLTKHIQASDEQMIDGFNKYMMFWRLSMKDKRCSTLRRTLRSMRQAGQIIEVKRTDRKNNSSEVFYELPITTVTGKEVQERLLIQK